MPEITGVLKHGNLSINKEMSDRLKHINSNALSSFSEAAQKSIASSLKGTIAAQEQAAKLSGLGNTLK